MYQEAVSDLTATLAEFAAWNWF